MADKSINELTQAASLYDSGLLVVYQDSQTQSIAGSALKQYATADVVSASATTLSAGTSATASYNAITHALTLGIPQGIQGEQGVQGIQGETGRGLTILGYYATVSALEAAVPSPSVGDAYGIGASEPYDIYIWDNINDEWVNNGAIQGPNTVSTSTSTNITGLLKGNGSNVSAAVADTDYATPSSVSGKISDPSSKSNGQVLTYNGSNWTAQTPSYVTLHQYTATLASNGWTTSGGYKTQTVTVTGIKSSYTVSPVIDCSLTGSNATTDAGIIEGFQLISLITTSSNSITAKCCGDAPSVNVPLIINVWE